MLLCDFGYQVYESLLQNTRAEKEQTWIRAPCYGRRDGVSFQDVSTLGEENFKEAGRVKMMQQVWWIDVIRIIMDGTLRAWRSEGRESSSLYWNDQKTWAKQRFYTKVFRLLNHLSEIMSRLSYWQEMIHPFFMFLWRFFLHSAMCPIWKHIEHNDTETLCSNTSDFQGNNSLAVLQEGRF